MGVRSHREHSGFAIPRTSSEKQKHPKIHLRDNPKTISNKMKKSLANMLKTWELLVDY